MVSIRKRRLLGERLEQRTLLTGIVVSEVHYAPSSPTPMEVDAGFTQSEQFQFIEIANPTDIVVDLSGLAVSSELRDGAVGVEFEFSGGTLTSLEPDERAVIVADHAAFIFRNGNDTPIAGAWSGALGVGQNAISLSRDNQLFHQFTISDAWYPDANGAGASLEFIDASSTDPSSWDRSSSWSPSRRVGGSPGYGVLGDVNRDGRFNFDDLSLVVAAGKYDSGEPATFAEGDWNGDGRFASDDLVFAFVATSFEHARPPKGIGDAYRVDEDGQLVVSADRGVLENDVAAASDELRAALQVPPMHGVIEFDADGSFRYTPDADYFGQDAFVYVPFDGDDDGTPTTALIEVFPSNDPPVARAEFYHTQPDTPFDVAADAGLLANDFDLDHNVLVAQLVLGPANGTLQLGADGSFSYVPRNGFQGVDRLRYRASDGTALSQDVTVSISVNPEVVVVSEIAASVQNSFRDYDDDSSDWIELTNVGSASVDLQGWYLTDRRDDLTRWQIPVETVIEPGASLVIVASGKDFVAPTGELHTDFRLSRSGEYLAVVDQDRSLVWDMFPTFPESIEDMTYGSTETSTTRTLVSATSLAQVHVPLDDRWGSRWTTRDFDDSNWSTKTAAIGYTTQLTGRTVPGLTARMIKVDGGRVSLLETARDAESLLNGEANREDYFISQDVSTIISTVNFGGIQSVTPGGDFPDAIPYPDGTTLNRLEDFIVQVRATVTIPEGEWTIGFGSSDGGLLTLDGVSFLEARGESGDDEIIDGDDELIYNDTRRGGWTTGTFTVSDGPLTTTLDAMFFERRAADFFEIAIAQGHTTSRPSTRNDWALITDGVMEWSVQTVDTPLRPDFDSWRFSDVQEEMLNRQASVYSRVAFDVADASRLDQLLLNLRYDDGFVAYINGTEVVRDNVTAQPTAGSTADSARNDSDATLVSSFDLTSHLGLIQNGTNVFAIHGLNAETTASGFLLEPELVAVEIHSPNLGYMHATPGQPNDQGHVGLVLGSPTFSVPSGTFSDPFFLELASPDPRAEIRYTTDGTLPTETSARYVEPIEVLVSSQVRARAFLRDHAPSLTASQLFVRMAEPVRNFNSDLPLIVIDTFGQDVPLTSSTVFANSAGAIFEPDESGRSSLANPPDLIRRVGFRERGSSSAGFPKAPYRLEFRQDHSDDDRDVALLGLPEDSDFILVPGYEFDRSMNRNTVVYELSNQAGTYAARTRYVEVFVNADRGELLEQHYMGVYALIETVKVTDDRMDIGDLSPQYASESDVTGGYIFKFDRLSPGDNGVRLGSFGRVSMVEPSESELEQRPAQMDYLVSYVTDFMAAVEAPDFRHPELGLHYSEWVDIGSLIDHYLFYELWQATDALFFSGHWFKERDGKLHAGPIWDFDRSAASTDVRNNDPRRWNAIDSAPAVWLRIFEDLEFRQAFIDRWSDLQRDVLSVQNFAATYDGVTQQIAEAQVRNFQRWPEKPPRSNGGTYGVLDGTWEGEVLHMKRWLQDRHHWMNSLFLTSPDLIVANDTDVEGMYVLTRRGDLNRDNEVDAIDMALLSQELVRGTQDTRFDVNSDGAVDQLDVDEMLRVLDTVEGDADLDGDVDADDEAVLAASQQNPLGDEVVWTDGDFDVDGDVDANDVALLAANLGFDRSETIPTGDVVYFTVDGTDPRLPGGAISPSARLLDGSFTVTGPVTVVARAYAADFNVPVRGFQQDVDDHEAWSGATTIRIDLT